MQPSPRLGPPAFGYQTATYLVRRGGVWQYRRRVPKALAPHLATIEIRVSTKARDRTDAMRAAVQISAALEAQWSKLIGGDPTAQVAANFQAANAMAEALGLTYRPVADIAASRLEDLLARIERLAQPLDQLAGSAVAAALPPAHEQPARPLATAPNLAPAPADVETFTAVERRVFRLVRRAPTAAVEAWAFGQAPTCGKARKRPA